MRFGSDAPFGLSGFIVALGDRIQMLSLASRRTRPPVFSRGFLGIRPPDTLYIDNINPPLGNPFLLAPDTFTAVFQPGGNAVSCVFNNNAGTGEIVLSTWSALSQGILNICGSVGGSQNVVGLTGLLLSVQNAQVGFGQCGVQAEAVLAELGHPNDPSTLVVGTIATNGTILSVNKHSINN
ncbi:hypothetical protein B0H16DRAFT_1725432 [Mycena metata]|uniref:Uncharacterized protein n=1 Tax=Mycena metata TaxID=1033252 RepID=A0AAD7ITY4_9AGAR|nr:hypothetical protein B0H16DRAFT_1725432 [Mycena metata]